MTLGLALVIVLAFLAVALGFAVYHLTTRVSTLETAISGGLETPERPLSGNEFAARFANATERASLAREFGAGVALFVDGDCARSNELLEIVANLATGRGITLAFRGDAPASRWPADTSVHSNLGSRFERAGVVATPFGMTISDGRVLEARLLGSDAALYDLLGTRPGSPIEPTPLEVD